MSNCGIYKITNLINNKVYIGQSININKRIWTHKYELKNNKHDNIYLQNSFNKYGINDFNFSIIELCDSDMLNDRECYWVSFYKSCDRKYGYNIQMPNKQLSYNMSDETKNKLRECNIKVSDDDIFKMLIMYFKKYNKIPFIDDFTREYKGMITGDRVKARFNGFKNAIEESGMYNLIDDFKQTNGYYNRELLLKFLKNWIELNGKSPTQTDINNDSNMPSITPYLCEFKSLNYAIELLGYKPRRKGRKIV